MHVYARHAHTTFHCSLPPYVRVCGKLIVKAYICGTSMCWCVYCRVHCFALYRFNVYVCRFASGSRLVLILQIQTARIHLRTTSPFPPPCDCAMLLCALFFYQSLSLSPSLTCSVYVQFALVPVTTTRNNNCALRCSLMLQAAKTQTHTDDSHSRR